MMADDEGNSEFKFRALEKERGACGSVTWDMRRVPGLSMKGFPFQYRVATGGVVPTQFLKVLLQRTPNRTNPALSFLRVSLLFLRCRMQGSLPAFIIVLACCLGEGSVEKIPEQNAVMQLLMVSWPSPHPRCLLLHNSLIY